MNQEDALIHLREIAKRSPEVTACPRLAELKKHQAAFKVVDKLIAQRTAKRMWREVGKGEQPDHAKYPDHPLNTARKHR
jgi:hypothetical protein